MFDAATLEEALGMLGQLLADRGHAFEVVAIGGGGLLLIGIIDRPTKDLDLVALRRGDALVPVGKTLPPALGEAVVDVARVLDLAPNWLNGGPDSLLRFGLPEGFLERLVRRVYGGLTLFLASRFDQIHFKLYAAADDKPGGKHHVDLTRLQPTHEELRAAARWAQTHDPSEGFAIVLGGVLRSFGATEDAE
jgi:hypothetical protein